MIRRLVAFLAALAWLGAPATAKPRNWATVVSATSGGGYLVGNPKAPVKVIEYFSLTCPHCRHFVETGLPPLKANYIARGRVSLELRNFVLNAPDMTAALLVHCTAPAKAAQLTEQIFADQQGLFDPVFKMSADAQARIQAVPDGQKASVLARETGIDKWFIARGLAPKTVAACLADPAGQERLLAIRAEGVKSYEVPGTPSFVVNGKRIEGVTWDVLETAIKAAGS